LVFLVVSFSPHSHSVYKTLTEVINAHYRNTNVWWSYTTYIRRKNTSTAVSIKTILKHLMMTSDGQNILWTM
jgi:hypothetical protein